jgi:hypothetical protein
VLLARPECGAIATTVHFYARSKGSAHCACEDEKSEALFFFSKLLGIRQVVSDCARTTPPRYMRPAATGELSYAFNDIRQKDSQSLSL